MTLPRPARPPSRPGERPLPLDDPFLRDEELDLATLSRHWAEYASRPTMTAEQMRGADTRAQRAGVKGSWLMEQAGFAVAVAARALLNTTDRRERGPVLILAGAGNNGGDGHVAARHLAAWRIRTAVVLVAAEPVPTTPAAARNWELLQSLPTVDLLHAATGRDVTMVGLGIEKAALVIDALLGTGIRGLLRDPVRSAVEVAIRARAAGVPVLAVDCPTALDLTSGEPSDPVVRADVTVTFHRPKEGLRSRAGRVLGGRELVAPIGIPSGADPTWR